jgi:hypothetical protein
MIIDTPDKSELACEALIYENANGVVYARFRDEPKKTKYNGRWIIGGELEAVNEALGIVSYDQWKELFTLADNYPTLRKQLDKTLNLYYIIKDGE